MTAGATSCTAGARWWPRSSLSTSRRDYSGDWPTRPRSFGCSAGRIAQVTQMDDHRQKIDEQLVAGGVVAVVRLDSASALAELTETLRQSGITAMEFTLTTPGALEALKALAPRYDDVLFG